MTSYTKEFPADYTVPEVIANDPRLDDVSWHNDVCPSFTVKGYDGEQANGDGPPDVRLWVNHPVVDSREFVEQARFMVNDSERGFYFESNDEADAAKAVQALIVACAMQKLKAQLRMMTDDELVEFSRTPHLFDPPVNAAALLLDEMTNRKAVR